MAMSCILSSTQSSHHGPWWRCCVVISMPEKNEAILYILISANTYFPVGHSLATPTLLLPLVQNTCNNFFCATHVGHVGFVPELGW